MTDEFDYFCNSGLLVLILAVVFGIASVIVPVYLVLKKELEGKPNYNLVEFCS